MKWLSVALLLGLAAWLLVTTSMAREDYTICSPFDGVLTDAAGQPLSNVRIRREWAWARGDGQDWSVTDDAGRFAFDEVTGRPSFLRFLPGEITIRQRYFAELPEDDFNFLAVFKRDYDPLSEFNGQPTELVCRTGVEPGHEGFAWGTCEVRSD
jgi:hypothetical protein